MMIRSILIENILNLPKWCFPWPKTPIQDAQCLGCEPWPCFSDKESQSGPEARREKKCFETLHLKSI